MTREKLEKWDFAKAIEKISAKVTEAYEAKVAEINEVLKENGRGTFGDYERTVLLRYVTDEWVDHIDSMDQLRKGIGLRSYAQTDPVIAYKQEGSAMFNEMIERIQNRTIDHLLRVRLQRQPAEPRRPQPRPQQAIPRIYPSAPKPAPASAPAETPRVYPSAPHAENQAPAQDAGVASVQMSSRSGETLTDDGVPEKIDLAKLQTSGSEKFNPATMKKAKKPGANDPCWCGSGLKYKKCHMLSDEQKSRN